MANNYFQFKQFKIEQTNVAMKVGTDSVILGAWANIYGSSVLDIGTGTGILSIMLAQRNPSLNITAIEIDELAYRQAVNNVESCKWKDSIKVELTSFQDFLPSNKFDLIICNPPYFSSLTSGNKQRTLARHSQSLPFNVLLEGCVKLLNADGKLCLILPTLEGEDFLQKAESLGLYCNNLLEIYPRADKDASRLAMELSFIKSEKLTEKLIIEIDRHIYTQKYKDLTEDFYLTFK